MCAVTIKDEFFDAAPDGEYKYETNKQANKQTNEQTMKSIVKRDSRSEEVSPVLLTGIEWKTSLKTISHSVKKSTCKSRENTAVSAAIFFF